MKGDTQRSISIQKYWNNKKKSNKHREINRKFMKLIGLNQKGKIQSNKFKKHLSRIRKNEKNPNWYGEKVGYNGIHSWVKRHKPKPKLCENCKRVPPYDLANISGEYKRDINDFKWTCRKCHMEEDGRVIKVLKNLKQFRRKNEKNK